MIVLDASAILAFLGGEPGAADVQAVLDQAVIGAANWSEVAQRISARGADWPVARALLESYGVTVEPVIAADAEQAAALWAPDTGLSLGDRLCLALGQRLEARTFTADRAWGRSDNVVQIR